MFRTIRLICSGIFISLLCVNVGQAQVYEVLSNGVQIPLANGFSQSPTSPITDSYTSVMLLVTGGATYSVLDGTTINSYSGGTTINGGSILYTPSDTALGNLNSVITLGDTSASGLPGTLAYTNTNSLITSLRNFTLNPGGGIIVPSSGGTELAGIISGSGWLQVGSLTNTTQGTLTLTGVNTYTGGTFVETNSTLAITKDAALGTSSTSLPDTLKLDGGTLQFNSNMTLLHNIQLTSNGGSININGYNTTITPGITPYMSESGGLTVYDNSATPGTLTLNGDNTYTGATIVNSGTLLLGDTGSITSTSGTTINGGTLQIGASTNSSATLTSPVTVNSGGTLSGSGTVIGNVTNSGTVSPGSGTSNTLTINGNYTQNSSGNLLVNIYSSGASMLKVTGSVVMDGTITLDFKSSYLAPTTYVFLAAPTANFPLGVQPTNGSLPSTTIQIQSNNKICAGGTVNTPCATGSYTNAGYTYEYLTLSEITGSLPDIPTVFPAMTTTTINEAQQANQTLLSRLQEARINAMADNMTPSLSSSTNHRFLGTTPFGAWVQPTGSMNSQSGGNGAPAFTSNSYGMLTGYDAQISPGFAVGGAVGFNHVDLNETGGASGSIDIPRLAAYGGWWRGRFAVDGLLSVGMPSSTTSRPVLSTGEIASGSYTGYEVSSAVQASLNFKAKSWVLTPTVGAKYVYLINDTFVETGTDIYNITVPRTTTNSARPFVEGTASRRFKVGSGLLSIVPEFRLGYEAEVAGNSREIYVQSEGDATRWAVPGVTPSSNFLSAKAAVNFEIGRSGAYYIDYDRIQNGTSDSNLFTAGYRYRM